MASQSVTLSLIHIGEIEGLKCGCKPYVWDWLNCFANPNTHR